VGPIVPEEMVGQSDLIVRATAVEYAQPPSNPNIRTTGEPDSQVRFRVDSLVKGRKAPPELQLPGYLTDADDYNENSVPYHFVRRGGRAGSCFANMYKTGGQYLLVLKLRAGAYTINWYALGPTNEQLHGPNDPWLVWVQEQVRKATTG
jgi:hypothetical protein